MTKSNLELGRTHLNDVLGDKISGDGLIHSGDGILASIDLKRNAFVIAAAGILEMYKIVDVPVRNYWNNFMEAFFRNGTDNVVDPYGSLCAVVAANALGVDNEGILDNCLDNHLKYGLITGHSGNKAKYSGFYPVDNAMAVLAIENKVLARQIADNSLRYLKNSKGILIPGGAEEDDRPGSSKSDTIADNSLAVLAAINAGYVCEAKDLFSSIEKEKSNINLSNNPRARILMYMASLELSQHGCKANKSHSDLLQGMDYGCSAQIDALYAIALAGRTLADATKRR